MTDHQSPTDTNDMRYRTTVRVTIIGSVVDLSLGIAKIAAGFVSHSQALIADGIHSLSDLVTDGFVLYAAAHAAREADEDHPYGHKRFEAVATVALGLALILVALGIAYDAGQRLFNPDQLLQPGPMALVIAMISIVAKEAIYHYTMHAAHKFRSDILRANAWHSRTDAVSSIIVVIGILGTMSGLNYLDALAAIGVALMIVKVGWGLMWHSLRELVDTGLEPDRVKKIREAILAIDGVTSLHMLRTRRMGGEALADVHIQVHPTISVSEGHHISETVRTTLINNIDELFDVTVHIDTENDQAARRTHMLPLRSEIIRRAMTAFEGIDAANEIEQVSIHYLDGKVQLELLLPLERATSPMAAKELEARFTAAAQKEPMISRIHLYFR